MSFIFSFIETFPTIIYPLCKSLFRANKKLHNVSLEGGTNLLATHLVYVAERARYAPIGSLR